MENFGLSTFKCFLMLHNSNGLRVCSTQCLVFLHFFYVNRSIIYKENSSTVTSAALLRTGGQKTDYMLASLIPELSSSCTEWGVSHFLSTVITSSLHLQSTNVPFVGSGAAPGATNSMHVKSHRGIVPEVFSLFKHWSLSRSFRG